MIVVDIKSTKTEFVRVVNADGDPLPEFTAPVPASWIGTDLLPEGAKKAPAQDTAEAATDSVDVDVTAQVEERVAAELAARTAELDAREKALAEREAKVAEDTTPKTGAKTTPSK